MVWSHDSSLLVVAPSTSAASKIDVYDVQKGEALCSVDCPNYETVIVKFCPNSKYSIVYADQLSHFMKAVSFLGSLISFPF